MTSRPRTAIVLSRAIFYVGKLRDQDLVKGLMVSHVRYTWGIKSKSGVVRMNAARAQYL